MHAKLGQGEEAKLQNFHVSQFHVLREACETIWKKTRRSQWLLGTDWRGQARALNDWLLSLCFSKRSFCSFQKAETCGCCHSCSSPLRMRGQVSVSGHFRPPRVHAYPWRLQKLPGREPKPGRSSPAPGAQRHGTAWEQPLRRASEACELHVRAEGVITRPAAGRRGRGM